MDKKKWLRITGYVMFCISCLSFLFILVIPWLGFSKAGIAGVTTGLIVTGEVLFYSSLLILGKSFWHKIKGKLAFRKVKTNNTDLPEQGS